MYLKIRLCRLEKMYPHRQIRTLAGKHHRTEHLVWIVSLRFTFTNFPVWPLKLNVLFWISDISHHSPNSRNALLSPLRPKCNSVLHLFGEWLFEASYNAEISRMNAPPIPGMMVIRCNLKFKSTWNSIVTIHCFRKREFWYYEKCQLGGIWWNGQHQ